MKYLPRTGTVDPEHRPGGVSCGGAVVVVAVVVVVRARVAGLITEIYPG